MSVKDKTPIAGEMVTRCTKCKTETGHIVIAHNRDGIVAKVQCKACGCDHRYYSDKKREEAKLKRKKHDIELRCAKNAEDYARLMDQYDGNKIIPYRMMDSYEKNDIISHKTFGKGAILNVYPQKIDVLFETGPRILACNRSEL